MIEHYRLFYPFSTFTSLCLEGRRAVHFRNRWPPNRDFKYIGNEFEGDMKRASEGETRRWWKITNAMKQTLVEGATSSEGGDCIRKHGKNGRLMAR
ncbi:hypothetical protein M422DRAFT_179333 [Sphaerobolus stellatus SS14]|uniref:Uncharacterized protein n=1 Tax=Sphaerobolus stellatus (strain SS14) TaxID=990650 RepID=A0A0C9V481_SPHS4|nr:hypothetical protein M422DRAFT_179333 [Sphaerobolus stellatus SS14]